MTKRVLNVGQCIPDQMGIAGFLKRHFDVSIVTADDETDTFEQLRQSEFDLVLINRKLDADYSDGLRILKSIKTDDELSHVPLMLVSNFPEAHEAAVKAGGEYGFGKADYSSTEAVERLARFLAESAEV